MLGYLCAYYRYYYPIEFCTAFLNCSKSDEDILNGTLLAKQKGFTIDMPKFRESGDEWRFNKDEKKIYKSLKSIKDIGDHTGSALLQFKDFQGDFVSLLAAIRESKAAKKNELEILIKIGFFSEFGCCNGLLYIKQLFETFYGKKNLKKSKAEELGLDPQYLASISHKETKTQYMGIDMLALIRHLAETANIPEESIMQRALWESELLGYISITDPSMDGRYNIVTAVNDKPNKPVISLYCLKNGKNYTMRCKRSRWRDKDIQTTWKELPLQKNDFILMKGWKREPKPVKVGDEWKDSDELEWILSNYSILKRQEAKK